MELFYCVIIGILGVMLGYWLGNGKTNKKVEELIQKGILQNNQEYRIAENELVHIKNRLTAIQESIDTSDIVHDAESKATNIIESAQTNADRIMNKAENKVDRLNLEAKTARDNMLKEIEALREKISTRVQSFIDGNKPQTAEENLDALLKSPKGNRTGKFPNFNE